MKARLEALVAALRDRGLAVSLAEAMDAARAAALIGVEREALREALAAALVKDERDRAAFVAAFDVVFPARIEMAGGRRGRGRRRGGVGDGGSSGGGAATPAGGAGSADEKVNVSPAAPGQLGRPGRPAPDGAADRPGAAARPVRREPAAQRHAPDAARTAAAPPDDGRSLGAAASHLARLDRERRLLRLPFRDMAPADVEACADLARAIAARIAGRVRRRLAARPRGRLDLRRTIRAAIPRGGVLFERRWRDRRPGPPDLVALCDLSASAATATGFFLALLAPAASYFRRVRLFGFVDRLVEIEFADGQVRPAAPIDLMARSDFGRVLGDLVEDESAALGADTVLLILGDARNNRLPARADLLAAVRARVRRVLWLNPEPRERWDTGDSVMATYARHVDAVVACGTLAELERALGAI
ncbi:MAG: hypothetical protein B6D46_00625 [Polyangiaceae bacterium UTPRO1]|jgi:uncharacterized protein with von Willebrand factor type A (vWA) domain|nr:VWA domain-containing protein [Myxococcales bacterium]OQY69246.1 MAG: hypothetical protein B6D46_00625 [Polyangiaceae bacterium UTPRO1]